MTDMFTAKEMQNLLQVDRSTIYRMAEAGQLPAIKVGKQWRFPAEQVDTWLEAKTTSYSRSSSTASPFRPQFVEEAESNDLKTLLPIDCVQLMQDSYADLLGVMLVVTDMKGNPLTQASNPCGLFTAVNEVPGALQKCIQSWHTLATDMQLEPHFNRSHLGLLCARGMIRVGTELKGMVVAGCIAPERWPPSTAEVETMTSVFGVSPEVITAHLEAVHHLDNNHKATVLAFVQRIANIVAHIIGERRILMSKLETIANLAKI
jgi:excisionase family DNA binding protein